MALILVGAVAVLALAVGLGLRAMAGRPMFQPGTVVARITERGETLDPAGADGPGPWRVTADVALRHDSFGAGDDLVFVHGGPAFPLPDRPAALEQLGATHRVHLYDARGCGGSTRPFTQAPAGSFYRQLVAVEDALGLAEQLADLERIRRLLGRERLVLVGHSFGALIAALYAAEFPDRVSTLLLVSPASLLVMPADDDLFAQVGARLPETSREAWARYLAGYFDLPAHLRADEPSLSRTFGALREFYALAHGLPPASNGGDAGGFATLATYASLGRRHDWRAALGAIRARTIVVHGAGDSMPERASREFAAAIPGARMVVSARARHFAMKEDPELIRDTLLAAER